MATHSKEGAAFVLELHNPYSHEALFRLVVHWGSLPKTATLYLALGGTAARGRLGSLAKKELERTGITLGNRKARERFEAPLEERCGERVSLDLDRIYRLVPNQQRRTALPEMLIGPERPVVAVLRLVLPKKRNGTRAQFDVVQMAGARVVGGCTFAAEDRNVRERSDDRSAQAVPRGARLTRPSGFDSKTSS